MVGYICFNLLDFVLLLYFKMAYIEEHTDEPNADQRSPAPLNSLSDSANGSLDGASDHSSLHSGSRSDEQTIRDEQQPAIQAEVAGSVPSSTDTADLGRDVDHLEFNGSLIDPAAGSLENVASRARLYDDGKEVPAHVEKFRQFVERIKGKLLKSMEVFQQLCPDSVVSGTGGFNAQDAAHGSRTDSFTLDQDDSLNSPVFSSTMRHSASIIECNLATGTLSRAAAGAQQSLPFTPHRPPTSRPSNAFPFTSSPFVSNISGTPGFPDAVRESCQEYEMLLEETLCFVEQVFLKQKKKLETGHLDSDVSVRGPGQATGFEETDEVISLRQTEKDFKDLIQCLDEQLACKNLELLRLGKENDRLREQVETLPSYGNEQLEQSQDQIDSLTGKLTAARKEREGVEKSLKFEQDKNENAHMDMMETKRALDDYRNSVLSLKATISEQSFSIRNRNEVLAQNKEKISKLHSDLATAKVNRKTAEEELEREIINHSASRIEFEGKNKLLRKAEQCFERIHVFIFTLEGEQAKDNRNQGNTLPLIPIAGTLSNSFDGLAKKMLDTLKKIREELKISRAALKRINTKDSNEFETLAELKETVKEVKRQRDSQKERLTNLKHSILDAISTVKKLEPQRKSEIKSLNKFLKWVSCFWNDCDASEDGRSNAKDFLKQNLDMRTELKDLIKKSLMIECLIGFPTRDESVCANSFSLISGSSFREERESVEESSGHSTAARVNYPDSLEALDSTLCSTLANLVQFKLADRTQRSALVAEANAKSEELQKAKEEFETKLQTMARDNLVHFETQQKQFKESERELVATKELLKDLSLQITTTLCESTETVLLSEIIRDFEFGSNSPSDDSYVKIYLAPLRLLCSDVLNTDSHGTVQLCSLLRCCVIAVKEYGKVRKEVASLTKEIEVARQQTIDLAQSKETELGCHHDKMSELSHTLAQLSRDTLACTAKLRATSPWSSFPDPSTATIHQTSSPPNNLEESLLRLSYSVAFLTATVDMGILNDLGTLNEQRIEIEKAHDSLLADVSILNAEVNELEDVRKHLEDKRRRLCKLIEDEKNFVNSLQERLDQWGNFIEREEPIMRKHLKELAVLEAGFTEGLARVARASAGESEPARATSLGSHESRDSTVPDESGSTGADHRQDSTAGVGIGSPPPHHSYTRRRMAAVQEGTTDSTDGAAQARQIPLPKQPTCITRVLSSRQTPLHRNTVLSPVTRIQLSESLYGQLATAPDSLVPRYDSTSPLTSTSPGGLAGPPMITCRGSSRRVSSPRPPLGADDLRFPRRRACCAPLPDTSSWMPRFVVGCISSIAVVCIFYFKQPFLK